MIEDCDKRKATPYLVIGEDNPRIIEEFRRHYSRQHEEPDLVSDGFYPEVSRDIYAYED